MLYSKFQLFNRRVKNNFKNTGYLFFAGGINIKQLIFYFMKTPIIRAALALGIVLASCGPNKEEVEQKEKLYIQQVQTEPMADQMAPAEALYDMAPPPPPPPTNEEYAAIKEDGYLAVSQNPYSTFAIDVDAASYSNMRRMITEGTLPPKDEVRIEEWVNYFSYSYPQPTGGKPFSINTEYADCPWNSEHKLLHIGLKGKEIEQKEAAANNLVFLLDVSGSMEDADKLPLLKKAFRMLLPQLRSEDRVSIVVYAGAAGVVLKPTSGKNRAGILEALENLQAGGSTAGGEGIELAYKLAEDNFIKKGNNRIILATDGDFNVGASSEKELEDLITKKREKGIYLSVLGFGEGNIKDNKMELLADKGNGNYNYIDNILEARKVLVKQFGGTLTTIAKDVKIQIEFNPKYVKEYRLIGYENRRLNTEDFNDDKKDAGELGAGHTVTALYEVVLANSSEKNTNIDDLKYQKTNATDIGKLELANIKFRYKDPGKNDTTSKLISQVVFNNKLDENKTSLNFKLASSVTEFALLMRDSDYKSKANFDQAIALAKQAKGNDEEGYVTELIRLMETSKDLLAANVVVKKD